MKLSDVEISEFQSIRSSNRFDIGEITCLVGNLSDLNVILIIYAYGKIPLWFVK